MGYETYGFFDKPLDKYDFRRFIKMIDNSLNFTDFSNRWGYSTINFKTSKSSFSISIHYVEDESGLPHPDHIQEGVLLGMPETEHCIKMMKAICSYFGGWILERESLGDNWLKIEQHNSEVIKFIFTDF